MIIIIKMIRWQDDDHQDYDYSEIWDIKSIVSSCHGNDSQISENEYDENDNVDYVRWWWRRWRYISMHDDNGNSVVGHDDDGN